MLALSRRTKLDIVLARSSLAADHLCARPWRLLEFDSPVLFTGDQPASFFVSGGLVATNVFEADEIRWPLSRRYALVLGTAPATDGERRRGSTAEADSLNGSAGDWAFEWTYDHPNGPTQTMYRKWIASTTSAQRVEQKQSFGPVTHSIPGPQPKPAQGSGEQTVEGGCRFSWALSATALAVLHDPRRLGYRPSRV